MVVVGLGQRVLYFYKGPTKATSGWFGDGATVIGQDRGLVLVRHGAGIIRSPPEYIRLDPDEPVGELPTAAWSLEQPVAYWSDDDYEGPSGVARPVQVDVHPSGSRRTGRTASS